MPIRIKKAKEVILQTLKTELITKSHSTTPFTRKNKDALHKIRPTSKLSTKRKKPVKNRPESKRKFSTNRKIPHSLECGIYKRVYIP